MEVNADRAPSEGEVYVFTTGGGFVVKGSTAEVARRLAEQAWAHFELAESDDPIIIRSDQVVALRGGTRSRRGSIGFTHNG